MLSRVYEEIQKIYDVPKQSESVLNEKSANSKNPYKSRIKYKSQNLTQYSKKEQKLIGKIYEIIKAILPHDMADIVVNKIQEELSK